MNLGNLRMPSYFKSYAGIRSIWNTSDIWNFEIATEEQIQLTKSTTSCTSNTDECIFHITWVQSCNTGAAKKKSARAVKITSVLTFCDAFLI